LPIKGRYSEKKVCIKGNSDFEIHALVVESLESENPLSRKMDRWLNRKYKKEMRKLSGLAQEEFIRQWEASSDREEVEGILWVAG
jgi:hypothetical protein